MKKIRFLMLGGFLGAGKTTAIARIARHYRDEGLQVGLVTNDQAFDLVDTLSLRSQGFDVGEVPGACFCCKFDDLVATTAKLADTSAPDIIITEPVGSCTDLVATVIEPLAHLHQQQYEIGPLAVLLKPEHGRKILDESGQSGFSPKAAYIFLKQIEEADIIVVNKIDKLTDEEQRTLVALVLARFPEKRVLAVSAKTGDGFPELLTALSEDMKRHESFMEVDYDVYAEGEAELGWLNCQTDIRSENGNPFSLDSFVVDLVSELARQLRDCDIEPAHLKVLGQDGERTAIANLVDSDGDVELSLSSAAEGDAALK